MLRRLSVLVFSLCLLQAAIRAQDTPLQGRWVVTGGEHGGKPMDAIKGGVMTVTGNAFEVRTASGNLLKGTLRVDASKKPMEVDLTHADGEVWEAIVELTSDGFRMNYVEKGEKDPRPKGFTTSAATEESVVTLRHDAAR